MVKTLWRCGILTAVVLSATLFDSPEVLADKRPDIVVAVNKLPRSLEPVEKTGNVDVRVHYSVYDTLIRRDFLKSKGGAPKLIPSLAVSWKRIDTRTLELKLRKGVKFHDGSAFTADDVVFTFSPKRIAGKKALLRRGRRYFGHLKSVKKIDDHTVRIVTKKPDLLLEQRLATLRRLGDQQKAVVLHKKAGEEWAAKQPQPEKGSKAPKPSWMQYALKKIRWNPVGTGPAQVKGWKKKSFVAFTANDNYFLGKPNFKSVTFKAVPEQATRIAGLSPVTSK